MAYTAATITAGDTIAASWGNKVETHLERLGNYMGVVAAVANLPDVATIAEGDWYWCKAERLAKMKVGSVYLNLNAIGEVASSAPTTATGVVWYDTTNKVFKIYSGSEWIPISESRIDTSKELSTLQSALLAQNPSVILSSIANTALWNYLLKSSTVRSAVLAHKMYIDAMIGMGASNLALDTDMEDAILGSISTLSKALPLSSFWNNSAFLTYWMNNYWTKNNYSTYATTTVDDVNSKKGFKITCNARWTTDLPYFSIDLDLTNFDNLDFWYSRQLSLMSEVRLFVGDAQVANWSYGTSSGNCNIDISGYSGVQTVKFRFNDSLTFYFTDLRLS